MHCRSLANCSSLLSGRKCNSCAVDSQVLDHCQPAEVRSFHPTWQIRPKARALAWDPGPGATVPIRDISTSESEDVTGQWLQQSTSSQRTQGAGSVSLEPGSGGAVYSSDLIIGRLRWELFQEVTLRCCVPRKVMSDNKFASLNHDVRRLYLNRRTDGNVGVQVCA